MLFKKNKEESTTQSETVNSRSYNVWTIVGIVLCVLLIPILIINCTLIIKSWVNEDEVPSIGGLSPLIVLTDSMDPTIKSGDIIICKAIEGKDVELKDVISFFDPAGNGSSVVTHRVCGIKEENGIRYFQTIGDNNNVEDRVWVPEGNLVGVWTEFRVPFVGRIALFMQTTGGLLICILLPLGLFLGYELFRRKKEDAGKKEDLEALKRELEALRAQQAGEVARSNETEVSQEQTEG